MKRKYRMYGLVPYQLSGIQAGIQFMHAAVDYGTEYPTSRPYQQWRKVDKTVVVLNGGTTNGNWDHPGTIDQHVETLRDQNYPFTVFREPDLGDLITGVAFLVDDRVWDKETWPDFKPVQGAPYAAAGTSTDWKTEEQWALNFGKDHETVVFMRTFLKQFRLAAT